jgi:hypothetical protein
MSVLFVILQTDATEHIKAVLDRVKPEYLVSLSIHLPLFLYLHIPMFSRCSLVRRGLSLHLHCMPAKHV